ncbi:GIY-YIG nuclease family protein [Thermovibrio sp.]
MFKLKGELSFKVRGGKPFNLKPSLYLYVGSAFGSGGLKSRLLRHLKRDKKNHWHLDFITTSSLFFPISVYLFAEKRVECKLALRFSKEFSFVPSFGSSDCTCPSHLFLIDDTLKLDSICREFGATISQIEKAEKGWILKVC